MGFSKSFNSNTTGYTATQKTVGENYYIKVPRQLAEFETKNTIRFRFCLKNNNAALNVFSSEVYENKCFNYDIVSIKINIKNPEKKYQINLITREGLKTVEALGEDVITSYETRMQSVHDLLIEYVQIQEKLDKEETITEEEQKKYNTVSKSFEGVKGELLADAYMRAWQEYVKYKEYLTEKEKEAQKQKEETQTALNASEESQETNQPAKTVTTTKTATKQPEGPADPDELEKEFDI